MTLIEPTSTLADLVTADPSLARELERRGLDYCCGGTRTLEQACVARELDADTVVEELIAASRPRPAEEWTTMDARQLVDHAHQRMIGGAALARVRLVTHARGCYYIAIL